MVGLAMGAALAVIVGANNGAISLGANMGAHVITHRGAVTLSVLGMTIGFLLEGRRMQGAVFGVIQSEGNPAALLSIIVLSTAFILMVLSTYAEIPLSLSQTTVGAVAGAALAVNLSIHTQTLAAYFASWTLTPVAAAVLAALIRSYLRRTRNENRSILRSTQLYAKLTIATSTYTAYILGANVLGVLAATIEAPGLPRTTFVLLAAVGGTTLFHSRIAQTAGDKLSTLTPVSGLATQLSAAATLHLFTEFGIPSSMTQALVGAILGTRLGRGVAISNRRLVRETVLWWLLAPLVGLLLANLLVRIWPI